MAPFFKPGKDGTSILNWQRIIEVILIVAINAAVIITTLQVKINYMEQSIARMETVIAKNDERVDFIASETAVCMDRLDIMQKMPRSHR